MRKLSDILRDTREDKKLNLDDVERETKIKKVYLKAIESGDFRSLPSESYALGFVKNYAKFLGIPTSQTVPLFRREYSSKNKVHIVPNFRRTQHRFNRKLFFNSRAIVIVGVFLVVAIYIFFQYGSFFFPPKLSISQPLNGAKISGNVVEVIGKTDPYATVEINSEEAFVNLQGTFRKSIYIFSGNTAIDIVAKNNFGKESRKTINVQVK